MRLVLVSLALLISGCDLVPQSHLERVQEKGFLLALTRNSATTYYEGPFGPTGLEYDLAAGFAKFLGVKLKIETPDTLSRMLVEIEGDVARHDHAARGQAQDLREDQTDDEPQADELIDHGSLNPPPRAAAYQQALRSPTMSTARPKAA